MAVPRRRTGPGQSTPRNEYQRPTTAVGGRICAWAIRRPPNPLELGGEPDGLTRRALFAHTLVAVLHVGPLDPAAGLRCWTGPVIAALRPRITTHPRNPPPPAPSLWISPAPWRATPTGRADARPAAGP